jgi:signal recognition particle subunit SEC65
MSPNLAQITRAARLCELKVFDEEQEVQHPAHWFSHDGRLQVEYDGSKEELLQKIAQKLNKV